MSQKCATESERNGPGGETLPLRHARSRGDVAPMAPYSGGRDSSRRHALILLLTQAHMYQADTCFMAGEDDMVTVRGSSDRAG